MPHNIRFVIHGAILAFVYMTIISSLQDIGKLLIVCALIAVSVLLERQAPKP
ncbi:MAG TPA: hypothetical protein VFU22_15300 [Roseiflexaceae bacterium]|nr:hypothetical protein [Roseiflexaceae bacterium]